MPTRRTKRTGAEAPLGEAELNGLAAALVARVRAVGAVRAKGALPKSLPRADVERVVERVARGGVERAGAWLRLPLDVQLRAMLEAGAMREKDARKRVRGASATEATRAVASAVARGEAVRVARLVAPKKVEAWLLAPGAAPTVVDAALEGTAALGADLGALLKAAKSKKGPACIECETLAELGRRLLALAGDAADAPPPPSASTVSQAVARVGRAPLAYGASSSLPAASTPSASKATARPPASERVPGSLETDVDVSTEDEARVLAAARRLGASRPLVYVPDLLRAVAPGIDPRRAHAALISLARRGDVELRQESGIGTLSASDAALCPLGGDGVPLSWLRLTSPTGSGG